MRSLRLFPSLLSCGVLSCGAPAGTRATEPFLAFDADFRDYPSWEAVDLGSMSLAGHPPGSRTGYRSQRADPTTHRYPAGTRIVKEIHTGATREDWEIFAMAKRGGGFNATGAVGWEFFRLRWRNGTVVITARGYAPSEGPTDEYAGGGLSCNTCHGIADAQAFDGVLSDPLRP